MGNRGRFIRSLVILLEIPQIVRIPIFPFLSQIRLIYASLRTTSYHQEQGITLIPALLIVISHITVLLQINLLYEYAPVKALL